MGARLINDAADRERIITTLWGNCHKPFLIRRSIDYADLVDNTPFSVINLPADISTYIMSDEYKGYQEVYPIIQVKLSLKLLTIEETRFIVNVNPGGPRLYPANVNLLNIEPNIQRQYDMDNNRNWDKYMFIRCTAQKHYDLITFDNPPGKKTIFNKNINAIEPLYNLNMRPPLYIYFLIYGCYASRIPDPDKLTINLGRDILELINTEYNRRAVQDVVAVVDKFDLIFRNANIPAPANSRFILGGAPTYRPITPYYNPNMGSIPMNNGMSLTNQDLLSGPPSNLSYHINVELNLYPGTSVPLGKRPGLLCEKRYDKMKHAWADFTGTIYAPRPKEYMIQKSSDIDVKTENTQNKTKRGGRRNVNKKTRRYRNT